LTNTSVNAESYIWDFSFSELENPGISRFSHQITGANRTDGIDIIHDNGEWIGFVTDRNTGLLKRLEFGNDLSNAPEEFSLGVVGVSGNGIRLLKEAGSWYALMPSYSNGNLYRLTFGENIKSTPTIESLGNISAWNTIRGSDLVIHQDSIYSVISAYSNDKVTIINFGTSITNSPIWHRDIQHNGLIDAPVGLSLYSDGDRLYSLISSNLNHKVLLSYFSEDLASEELFEIGGITTPTDVEIVKNGNQFYGIVLTAAAKMYKLSFGKEINTGTLPSAEQINLEGDALQTNTWCFRQVRTTPDWEFFVLQMTGNLKQIRFEDQNLPTTNFEPQNISYNTPGTYAIELTAYSANGNYDTFMDTVVVRNASAPTTSFTTGNACISNSNTFTATSSDDASVTSWSWDFGDGSGTATGQNVDYQFLGAGNYEVKLSIDATNGCSNTSKQLFSIYDLPQAGFTYQSGIVCSNSPLVLTNNTTFNGPDSILTFQWNMDGETSFTEINPSYTFSSGGDKNITLSASIPGCSSETAKLISITPGPLTSFTFDGSCEYEVFNFINNTTGDGIAGYQWDFGDGYSSTNETPSHQFSTGGSYVVSLTASNVLGCNTLLQQVVPVHFTPEINFTNDLACSKSDVTFYDQSSVTSANIAEQYWTLSNNTLGYNEQAEGPSPTFDLEQEGNYQMILIGISYYGCSDTLIRNDITVGPSPVADFTFENTCFGDSTHFHYSAELSGDVTLSSTEWLIDGSVYSGQDAKYKFQTPGEYDIEMYIRAENLCADDISKTINIFPLPDVAILLSSFCADQPVLISSLINSGSDPVSTYNWLIDEKPTSTQSNFYYEFEKAADYSLYLDVTTENNCFNFRSENITINPTPTSEFDIFPSIGANPLTVQFTDRSSGATGISYDFSLANDDVSSETDPTYVYQTLGKDYPYQVVWNEFGCADTSYVEVEVVVPVLDISIGDVSMEVVDDHLKLFVELSNNGTIIINNPNIRIDIDRKISVSQIVECKLMPGDSKKYEVDFDVLVKNEQLNYICFALDTKIGPYSDVNPYDNSQCLSIENTFVVLEPYPNPSHSFVELPIILPASGNCEIKMLSENGKLVFAREFKNMTRGLNIVKVDLSTYGQGLYLFQVSHEDFETTKKIVIR
jgi:PKD repeat protein